MPKRIIELVREKEEQLNNDPIALEVFGRLAAAAVNQGRGSQPWIAFMSQFVDGGGGNLSSAQLRRLLATDDTLGNETLDRKRAYLLSNRMCAGLSPGVTGTGGPALPLDFQVNSIDDTLEFGCLADEQPNPDPGPEPAANPAGAGD